MHKIEIKNKLPELENVVKFLGEFGKENNILPKIVSIYNIVLDEILSNTIMYGYEDKEEHTIAIEFELSKSMLICKVTDDAVEFDPTKVAKPDLSLDVESKRIGGLGIHIVKKMTDYFSYKRDNNKNIVLFKKKIS